MARTRLIPISLLCSMLFGALLSISAPAAEQSPWLEIHSTHYTVITDAGEKKGREVALRFEQMRAAFALLLMKDRLNEPVPLTILAFKSDKTYYQSAPLRQGEPLQAAGFFIPGQDHNFIVLNLYEEEPWRALAHDFASIRLDNKSVEIGDDPELQAHSDSAQNSFQNRLELRNAPKSLTELLSGQVWLALPDLLTMKHDTSSYMESTHSTLFYAQSWMMVHYLLHEKKLPETGSYFELVEN